MSTVAITGGTGLIGKAIIKALLQKGYKVLVFTREKNKPAGATAGLSYAHWEPAQQIIDAPAFSRADHIIHLAGASVAEKRWTAARKAGILSSRVQGGALLCKALGSLPNKVKTLISASAIGWYGADAQIPNPQPFTETAPPATDYLGSTCYQWEQSVLPVREMKKRLVLLRTGIVLSPAGGALKEFQKPLKFGLATVLGTGRQMISWIHIDDLVRLYIAALEDEKFSGIYNAVAPAPVSNKELVTTMARQSRGRFYTKVYVPEFMLKLMMGEMSSEVLKSATVSCEKLLQQNFVFQYPDIHTAVQDLARKR